MPKNAQARKNAKDRPADPETAMQPVLLRDSPASRTANAVQLVFLALCLRLQFPKLVEDPVGGLIETLAILVSVQAGWVLVCCPPAGSGETGHAPPHPLVPTLLSLALTVFSVPILHILFVLFGAPFLTHVYHTFLCSATLAILAIFPVVYAHGVSSKAWVAICGATAPWDEVFCGFWGGIIGAWLGAVPIPLDWDRDWQKWPLTVVCGIFIGYVIGRVVGNIMTHNLAIAPNSKGQAPAEGKEVSKKRSKKD